MLAGLLATQTTGTPATVGAAPGLANFSSPSGQAEGAAVVGASAGTASFTSAPGGASLGGTAGRIWWSVPHRSPVESERVAAVVGASPGEVHASSAPGAAKGVRGPTWEEIAAAWLLLDE